jgi:glutaredoxin
MLELFASPTCPFCAEVRAQLDWDGKAYVEYDVDADTGARNRLIALVGKNPIVPVLVEDGKLSQVGWQGRGCAVNTP